MNKGVNNILKINQYIFFNKEKIPIIKLNNQIILLTKFIANIHNKPIRKVQELLNKNLILFKENIDIIDLKLKVNKNILVEQFKLYNKQSFANSKNIYALTLTGYIRYLNLIQDAQIGKEILNIYFEYNKDVYAVLENRKEILFRNSIKNCLKEICTINFQHYVDGYKIDIYIPEFNLAIEYDEIGSNHTYKQDDDIIRQKYIENKLGCTFIRISETLTLEEGINIILKYIMKKSA